MPGAKKHAAIECCAELLGATSRHTPACIAFCNPVQPASLEGSETAVALCQQQTTSLPLSAKHSLRAKQESVQGMLLYLAMNSRSTHTRCWISNGDAICDI